MRAFFDPRQLAHAPALELHNGAFVPYAESPARAEGIVAALGAVEPAVDHGEAPLRAVHDEAYLAFLWSAHKDWRAAGRPGDAGAYAWPVVRRRPLDLDRIDARLGAYSFDASSPIAEGTWEGAYWSAQTALSALDAVLAGDRAAFALCRPPGHHAGADYLGGYCYLNNAAIAAEAATAAGRRVAILDIDYHHGNGTQDIFYARGDVFFASIHADPRTDYPYFWGHADETGEGAGEGATLNLPLPRGADLENYLPALEQALETIASLSRDLLICSFGADTYVDDPISHFRLRTQDYATIGRRIGSLDFDTAVIMEGGYATDAIGVNVSAFIHPFKMTLY
ncbi:histone deacetylase family protein [Sphingosinicella sp. LHD-64]|uniref:histone deacetylase family protein n=1 Tax=Sphingosinicella sp. LHD-64 TaxID=3072139 RepID=UPI00280FB57E|nr:histone deacetylase family protein [Sphingosinicella sp. LHD-64]MDQ8756656.1 histone deacetylase family protein [Sphingosinicella sp. LHD-64]